MILLQNLQKFLVKAKKYTYASGEENKKIKEIDHSTTLIFEEWDWKYHDNYFGWEPYGGRELVFFQDKPVYIMTYYWRVNEEVSDVGDLYKILQEALTLIPESNPYRWPEKYINWDYAYSNKFIWNVDNFSGEEIIEYKSEEVYKAKYIWWLVDQR